MLAHDDRFSAGLVLDGAVDTQPPPDPGRVSKPVMLMMGELDPLVPPLDQKRFYARIPVTVDRYLVVVPRAGHQFLDSCIDAYVAIPCWMAIPQDRLNKILAGVGTAFLLRYVDGQSFSGSLLDAGGSDYSLVRTNVNATPIALPTPPSIPFPTPAAPAPPPAGPAGTVLATSPQLDTAADAPGQYIRVYEAGEYVIRTPASAAIGARFPGRGAAALPGAYGDVQLSVDVRLVNPSDDQYVDLACRSERGTAEYRFTVGPSLRWYGVFRWAYDTAIRLNAGATPTINAGSQMNHMELTCTGTVIDASINGTKIGSIRDSSFGFGGLAIGAGHYSPHFPTATPPLQSAVEAHFTNIVVTQP
jgi:hypothetical protein